MTHIHRIIAPITLGTAALLLGAPPAASAQMGRLNLQSSEYRDFAGLPECTGDGCEPEHVPWVGYWWSYSDNGIASKRIGETSPAEKVDQATGADANMSMEDLRAHVEALHESLHPKMNERRDLVRDLNRMIARGDNYRDCGEDFGEETDACIGEDETACQCPWRRYRQLNRLIDNAKRDLPDVDVDTVTEWEHLNHGEGVAGVQDWWGHCNAWAAAAVLEPEPVREYTSENGITWSVGDVKALLTEAYMTMNSAFYGTRNEEDHSDLASAPARKTRELFQEGLPDRQIIDGVKAEHEDAEEGAIRSYLAWYRAWADVTPADFHILSSVYIGRLGRSFVIDRFTGSEVWNQPVSKFTVVSKEQLEDTEDGDARWLIRARLEWASDGVGPNEVSIRTSGHHYHDRELTYTLTVDASGRIKGDGEWQHWANPTDRQHPDFIWVPISDAPARPRNDGSYYENPHLDLSWLREHVLPHVKADAPEEEDPADPTEDPTEEPSSISASLASAMSIPDGEEEALCGPPDPTEGAGVLDAEIPVTGASFPVERIRVTALIEHTYQEDLYVRLLHRAPDADDHELTEVGTVVECPNGAGSGRIELDRTFENLGGAFRADGTYILQVVDRWAHDTGTLESAELLIHAD